MKHSKFLILNLIVFFLVLVVCFILGVYVLHTLGVNGFTKNNVVMAQSEDEDEQPPLIFNVDVDDVTSTSSTITWNTDENADSLINYGVSKNYGITRDPHFDKTEHKIILDDLEPGRSYFFRITSSDVNGNQGISSDYTFTTEKDELEEKLGEGTEGVEGDGKTGEGQTVVEEVIEIIKKITDETSLQVLQAQVQETAEQEVTPPTIILDLADVEVGTNYAVIRWLTDKESNSMVALAHEDDFSYDYENPYTWNQGFPDEIVLDHEVEVNGLIPATTYHFQVSSESVLGLKGISSDKTFTTKSVLPEIYNVSLAKIEEDSATITYFTNVPCSSIIEYSNLDINETKLEGNSSYLTTHSVKLSNLLYDTYYSAQIKVESEFNEKAESEIMTFITIKDEEAPVISKVNTESTLYPGSENKVQTIISWQTDESSVCQLWYHQGLMAVDEGDSLPPEEEFVNKHVQVVTNFLPSTVYKFWIVCRDDVGNEVKSADYTMLTPSQEESIIDIIIKNFESTFGWVKKVGK